MVPPQNLPKTHLRSEQIGDAALVGYGTFILTQNTYNFRMGTQGHWATDSVPKRKTPALNRPSVKSRRHRCVRQSFVGLG
ncbi:hypothetical protein BSFA1_76860 (plasmid) [Burkholderia sp. SFA1]|nr:hypothetical protein BSFA1_76860 [Burkholderia sp. SFA1]